MQGLKPLHANIHKKTVPKILTEWTKSEQVLLMFHKVNESQTHPHNKNVFAAIFKTTTSYLMQKTSDSRQFFSSKLFAPIFDKTHE